MAKNKKKKSENKLNTFEKFLERLTEIVGPSLQREMEKTFIQRPTTFRVNTIRATKQGVDGVLRDQGFKTMNVTWYKDAYILQNKTKRDLIDADFYTAGKVYVQSLASMVPPLFLDPKPGEKVLDLTAAPGSKTSQIAALMNKTGELVANDSNKIRFFKLKHNMELLGVTDQKEDWFFRLRLEHGVKLCREYPGYFDKILLDAPCSAEARFILGQPKTTGYWNERKIKEMAAKQRQLLFAAWEALKPGGTLIYSTCTFAPEENEVQVSKFLERHVDATLVPMDMPGMKRAPIVKKWRERELHKDIDKCLRIFPTDQIEGFFVAKMVKKE